MQKLEIKNRLDDLEAVSEWVNDCADRFQLTPKCAFRLDLILSEAITNVIQNAYRDEVDHIILITLEPKGNTVITELQDDGFPFDPTQNPAITLPTSLETATEGGLGIHLIRSYTEALYYRRQDDRNILTMIVSNAD